MKAYSKKCDEVLRFLKNYGVAEWNVFFMATGIKEHDAVLTHLKRKYRFLEFTDDKISLTQEGRDFITTTSFVQQGSQEPFLG